MDRDIFATWRRVDMYRINKSYHVKTDNNSSFEARRFRAPHMTHRWRYRDAKGYRFDPNGAIDKLNGSRTTIDKCRDGFEEVEFLY